MFLFADDMKLFNPIYNEDNCNNLQQDLTSAEKWTYTSLLKFHPDKCCHVRIGHSSIRNDGYISTVTTNVVTLRVNYSITRGHNL